MQLFTVPQNRNNKYIYIYMNMSILEREKKITFIQANLNIYKKVQIFYKDVTEICMFKE